MFSDERGTLATLPLTNGAATLQYHASSFRSWTITASYAGDSVLAPTVGYYIQTFVGQPTTTALTVNSNHVSLGDPFTITATVQPAAVTGSVSFYDSGTPLGNSALANGVATLGWQFSATNTGHLSAAYSGDTTYSQSSGELSLEVVGLPTTTLLVSSAGISSVGSLVRFTATVDPAPHAGFVSFYVDGAVRVSEPVSGGVATYTTGTLAEGSHLISATFAGGAIFRPSNSNGLSLYVLPILSPTLRVLVPNDGEIWYVGSSVQITWDTSNRGLAPRVSLYVSRSVPPEWELIAEDVPNTGSYTWTVTAPGTNAGATPVPSAMISVVDMSGRVGSDQSDLPFSIFDVSTEAAVTRFEAEAIETGVRISWALASAASFSSLELQRAPAESGPWIALAAEIRSEAGLSVTEDRTAEAGEIYWYRLLANAATGAQSVFGPVSVTTGGRREFALGAAWPNPSRGALAVQFTVATEARIKLSVVDLAGREVAVLAEGEYPRGRYRADWDARTDRGAVAAGVYFIRYATQRRTFVSRVAIVP